MTTAAVSQALSVEYPCNCTGEGKSPATMMLTTEFAEVIVLAPPVKALKNPSITHPSNQIYKTSIEAMLKDKIAPPLAYQKLIIGVWPAVRASAPGSRICK